MFYILFAVYIAAVNFFTFTYIRKQKKSAEYSLDKPKFRDGKLWIASLLGGAVSAFITMLLSKFRTDNLLLMVLLPLIAVFNVYIAVLVFKSGFLSMYL